MRGRRGGGRTVRLITALALFVLPATAQVTVAAPAAHAVDTSKGTPGYCPDADGVTVVIDFQELGGTTIVRCARGNQATGHAALKNAGIEIAGVARWGEAFICRIEGKPGANSEPCIDTPPASAYWSYWHSPNGGSWTYSQWGVLNRKPPIGSFEGWSFSKNKTETTNPPPRVAPSRPATPSAPNPPRTSKPQPPAGNTDTGTSGAGTTATGGGGTASASGGGGGGTSSASGANTTGATSAGSATTSSGTDPLAPGPGISGNPMESEPPTESTTASASAEPSVTALSDPTPPGPSAQPSGITPQGQTWTGGEESATDKRDGIPAMTIAGIALLLAICSAAGYTTWRRRTRADGSG